MIGITLLLTVVGSLAVALAANGTAAPVRLTATVGPGYTITLKKGTKVVRTLERGKYRITVRDRSDEHDFRLRGRSGRLLSSVGWAGTKTKTITLVLKPGRYTYVCDPHVDQMRGSFRVT
jgi:plastocyanin